MTTLLTDTATRANSTTAIGAPDVGGPYTVRVGTWGINSNQIYTASSTTNAHVTFPAAFNIDISVDLAVVSNGGVIFRWVDINNYWCFRGNGANQIQLIHRAAGVNTVIWSYVSPSGNFPNGTRIGIIAYGRLISAYINGVVKAEIQDDWGSTGASTAGLILDASSTARLDNVSAETADAENDKSNSWGSSPVNLVYDIAASDLTFNPSLYKGRDTAVADESEIP